MAKKDEPGKSIRRTRISFKVYDVGAWKASRSIINSKKLSVELTPVQQENFEKVLVNAVKIKKVHLTKSEDNEKPTSNSKGDNHKPLSYSDDFLKFETRKAKRTFIIGG